MQFDVLTTPSMRWRPTQLMERLYESGIANGIDARLMRQYEPRKGAVLILYGLGGRDRLPHAEAHMRSGGRVVSWDAGYWERKTPDRRYRVSIDGFHCPQRIMAGDSPDPIRWRASGLQISEQANPKGHIVLVGNGPKSGAVGAAGWAAEKSQEIRQLFPKAHVIYRPKRGYVEPNITRNDVANTPNIEQVLTGASLIVCRHSNVAVDACRMGIPVVCEDGAAAAIYPHSLTDFDKQPSAETRLEFLQRLAYWQWSESEIRKGTLWNWLTENLLASPN